MTTEAAEVLRLIHRIQAENLRLEELRVRRASSAELAERERLLERLRWRLAAAARRAARRQARSINVP